MASFEDLNKAVSEIRSDVVCHVCKEPARPGKRQWYRCMNLHQICQNCKEKKKKCSCGRLISLEYCKQTEKLLSVEGLKFNCINKKNGCQEAFTENALGEHESECIYRQVPCLFKGNGPCDFKPAFHNVIQHYENQHGEIPVHDLSKIVTARNAGNWCLSKCTFNNQTFLFCEKDDDTMNVEYNWVYILGSPSEAKHYAYTLKCFKKETKISFEGKVAAIDVPFETLLKTGKCFVIPAVQWALFEDENGEIEEFKYSLEIRNLKEEAKDENYESGISDDDEDSKQYGPNKRFKI